MAEKYGPEENKEKKQKLAKLVKKKTASGQKNWHGNLLTSQLPYINPKVSYFFFPGKSLCPTD